MLQYRSQYHTIQCNDRVKLDLRVEEGLEGRGDVIRVVVPIVSFAVAVAVIMRMVVMGHDENMGRYLLDRSDTVEWWN